MEAWNLFQSSYSQQAILSNRPFLLTAGQRQAGMHTILQMLRLLRKVIPGPMRRY